MALDISPKEVYIFIVWSCTRKPFLEEIRNQRVSGLSLYESGRWIQGFDVLGRAQSRRSCCALCAPARICVFSLSCSQFLLALVICTHDPHRLKGAIKSCVNGSEKSCVRADESEKSCVRAGDAQKSYVRQSSCVGMWKMVELKSLPTIKEIAIVMMQM